MNKICYLCLILTFISQTSNAQKSKTILRGKIINSNKSVQDVHIINLKSRLGTISNNNGEFEMIVKESDSLLISSLQFKSAIIGINKTHIKSKKIIIELESALNELDEVFLHGLSGSLNTDLNKTPKDTIPKHSFKYDISDLDKKLPGDEYGYFTRPNAESFTNPNYLVNGGQGSKFDRRLEAKRKLKRNINKKIQFPILIKKELGISYFTKTLKIPEDKIDHFLDYCEKRNITDIHFKKDLLTVIKILREESKKYHEIKK